MRRSIFVVGPASTLMTPSGSAGSFEPCWNECSASGLRSNAGQMRRRATGWNVASPQRSASTTAARASGSDGYSGRSG